MEEILTKIQTKLLEIPEMKYVDEDWGQLNLYLPDIPVQWPCVLFEVKDCNFDNIGNDRKVTPNERQMGRFSVDVVIGNLKLTNTSGRATLTQKNKAWFIHTLEKKVHEKLQGFRPDSNCSKLIRRSYQSIKRDDGVQEKHVIYDFEVTNV